jgi:hypothetical protein
MFEFYINNINSRNLNKFSLSNYNKSESIESVLSRPKDTRIPEYNEYTKILEDMHLTLCKYQDVGLSNLTGIEFNLLSKLEDYLDPFILNSYHSAWVSGHWKKFYFDRTTNHPKSEIVQRAYDTFSDELEYCFLNTVLHRLELFELFGLINLGIHCIEKKFRNLNFSTTDANWVEFDNIFPPNKHTSSDIGHFGIVGHHLGRSLYNKFTTFDHALEHPDETSWVKLTGNVQITLAPAETINYSKEYLDWCLIHNRAPVGENLVLGKISNFNENIFHYRKLFYRNIIDNNFFTIHN